jgi:signal transduction histidine kinase
MVKSAARGFGSRRSSLIYRLSIRRKLLIGFGVLIVLTFVNMAVNAGASYYEDRARAAFDNSQAEASQIADLKFEIQQARFYEAQSSALFLARKQGLFETSFDDALTSVRSALDLVGQLRTDTSESRSGRQTDEFTALDEIDQGLRTYEGIYLSLGTDLLVARGDENRGLAGDLIKSIEAVNERVDARYALDLATNYVTTFNQDVVLQVPVELQRLQTSVTDRPPAEQDEIVGLIRTARSAYLALLAVDMRIADQYLSLSEISEPTSQMVGALYDAEIKERSASQADFDAARETRQRVQVISLILITLAGVGLAYLIGNAISRPIEALEGVTQEIAGGNYAQRALVEVDDEVGHLARSFNVMAEAVQTQDAELREQANSLRVASAKAREAARLRSEFLSNMSHELRTPLNAIIGYSDMLLAGMGGELNPKQQHRVERLRENGKRLLDLVNDVLDLARIEAKRVEIQHKLFSPYVLIKHIEGQVAVLSDQRGLDFAVEIDPALPEMVWGDEKRIEQVVTNLLSNAFKFTESGSVHLHAYAAPDGRTWQIVVADTGIGIPPHAMDIIFEEFRQVDGSSTRVYKGTGLGLAISRHLVHLMNGQITVESELGQGSTFVVTLPLVMQEQILSVPENGKGSGNGSK